jgi:hypothetical protein
MQCYCICLAFEEEGGGGAVKDIVPVIDYDSNCRVLILVLGGVRPPYICNPLGPLLLINTIIHYY